MPTPTPQVDRLSLAEAQLLARQSELDIATEETRRLQGLLAVERARSQRATSSEREMQATVDGWVGGGPPARAALCLPRCALLCEEITGGAK